MTGTEDTLTSRGGGRPEAKSEEGILDKNLLARKRSRGVDRASHAEIWRAEASEGGEKEEKNDTERLIEIEKISWR